LEQADYLVQRLGGDPYYSANKGVPALILAHMHVDVSPRAAERWLDHFEDALDDVQDEVTPEEKGVILDHMRYMAYFLVAAQVQQREDAAAGIHFLD
jgi:truncated hemoglobin YjbI